MELGVRGLWAGPTAAIFLLTFFYNMIIASIDWDDLLQKMDQRTQDELNHSLSPLSRSISEFGDDEEEEQTLKQRRVTTYLN